MPVIKWVIVPEEPTEAMLEAAAQYRQECYGLNRPVQSSEIWKRMLAVTREDRMSKAEAAARALAQDLGTEIDNLRAERDRYAFIFGHVFTPALPHDAHQNGGCRTCLLPEADPIHHQHEPHLRRTT